jgi:hypothetical protein
MENKSFDRSLLIPIGVGVFALMGMCLILVAGRITALRANVQEVPTATPFKFALVGTEPAITTVTLEPTEFATPVLLSPAATNALSSTPITLNTSTRTPVAAATTPAAKTNTPTRTATSASTAPLQSNTYDDVDAHIIYAGDWTTQSNVSGAYQNTLHVSTTLGNTVTFRFIGQEMRLFFQAGPSLGTIRLNLDGTNYDMNENNVTTETYEWVLPSVTNGTHTVTITHLSGGSVNVDYIIIPEVPVTPTRTPTTRP